MQTREEQVDWTNFSTHFLEKYFPDTTRQDREVEFLALQKRDMIVQEYVNKFEHQRGTTGKTLPRNGGV